jgi:hypothetical protein
MQYSFTIDDTIDFDPVEVLSIQKVSNNIVITMPNQPCYSQMGELRGESTELPIYEVQFVISEGEVVKETLNTPFESDIWELCYPGGARYCFLPVKFAVNGPVSLKFEKEHLQLLIKGSSFEMNIVSRKESRIVHANT